ncbi:PIN domain-containing protein [Argonema antarcticum]|uniref:PIN domain-containing protein n=1 Tax=Argonema antarcticum TaxID=2942763 RepID=UPI00201130BC|nr:PIN domain-containing protein [Argonema antarcticum]MCL1473662.1 PIN domain-containing protein [Argonema antarcticum A004/B2]
MILYVETNFLLSIAKGQDPEAPDLLLNPPSSVNIAIPSICYMEALSALAEDLKYRKRFGDELRVRLKDAERNLTSAYAQSLAFHLKEAVNRNEKLIEEIEARLLLSLNQLATKAEIIELTADMLRESLQTKRIQERTDNLILHCILGHARSHTTGVKVFLSGNTRDFGTLVVQQALRDAGVSDYFSRTQDFQGWLRSQ